MKPVTSNELIKETLNWFDLWLGPVQKPFMTTARSKCSMKVGNVGGIIIRNRAG